MELLLSIIYLLVFRALPIIHQVGSVQLGYVKEQAQTDLQSQESKRNGGFSNEMD